MMLKHVVLPAPLGPIRETICPSSTVKLTACTAASPLKLLETPSRESRALISAITVRRRQAVEAQQPAERRPDAARQENDHEEKAEAIEPLLAPRHIDADCQNALMQGLGQRGQQKGADDGSKKRPDTADDRPEDQLDRAGDVKYLLGKQIVEIES